MKRPRLIPLVIVISAALLFLLRSLTMAGAPSVSKAPDLQSLEKSWQESRNKYRDALKEKRDSIQKEIEQKEGALEKEGDGHERKTLLDAVRGLRSERENVNNKIREINATDVVKFATGRDKILSTLTGQTPA